MTKELMTKAADAYHKSTEKMIRKAFDDILKRVEDNKLLHTITKIHKSTVISAVKELIKECEDLRSQL